jgi:hypothetical protein
LISFADLIAPHKMRVRGKLIYLFLAWSWRNYLGVAGASDFPHSRQDDLDRDVINPQNGHILCDA